MSQAEAEKAASAKGKPKDKEKDGSSVRGQRPQGFRAEAPGAGVPKAPRGVKDSPRRDDRGEGARKAREHAESASKALSSALPVMLEPPKVVLKGRKDEEVRGHRTGQSPSGGTPGGGFSYGARGLSFLDEISQLGSDDPYGGGRGDGDKQMRRPSQGGGGDGGGGGPPGGGGGRGPRKSSTSPSPQKPVRASKVIAPEKSRKRKRGGGDPGSDPDSSSDGDKKKKEQGDKKKKKDRKSKDDEPKRGRSSEKRKKKRKERKKDRRSSSSTRSSRVSEDEIYGRETAKYESLMEKAKRHPGKLLRSGLEQMSRFMNTRSGDDLAPSVSWREQRVNAYLNQVLFNQHPVSSMGMRNSRELVTLATAIDLLMEEQFASLGDLLMQRLKAVEASLSEGWGVANFQELIPPPRATLTTDQERAFAARHALQQRKLAESTRRKTG